MLSNTPQPRSEHPRVSPHRYPLDKRTKAGRRACQLEEQGVARPAALAQALAEVLAVRKLAGEVIEPRETCLLDQLLRSAHLERALSRDKRSHILAEVALADALNELGALHVAPAPEN